MHLSSIRFNYSHSAGWYGLALAKTFLQIHPNINVVLLESAESLGGTWCQSRLYPGLITQNMLDTYEYVERSSVDYRRSCIAHQHPTDFLIFR